jgi:hypothetical protein
VAAAGVSEAAARVGVTGTAGVALEAAAGAAVVVAVGTYTGVGAPQAVRINPGIRTGRRIRVMVRFRLIDISQLL